MSNRVCYNLWLYKSKSNRKNEAPIYLRITVNSKKTEISTGIYTQIDKWSSKKELIKGNSDEILAYNRKLKTLKIKLSNLIDDLNQKGILLTAELLKVKLLGKDKLHTSLLEAVDSNIDLLKSKVGIEVSSVPFKKLLIVKNRLLEFIKFKYSRTDIGLDELNYKFIEDFDSFLKINKGYILNTASATCQKLKRVIKYAISNNWINTDPFIRFQCKKIDVVKEHLTKDEIRLLICKIR